MKTLNNQAGETSTTARDTQDRQPTRRGGLAGFTLIELLVVIAIITILAGLIVPVVGALNRNKMKARVRAELSQVIGAVDAYHTKLGFYPPDRPVQNWPAPGANYNAASQWATNQLYYELLGTKPLSSAVPTFATLDGNAQILSNNYNSLFIVGAPANCSRGAGGDEAQSAKSFYPGIKPGQYLAVKVRNMDCTLLGTQVEGPFSMTGVPNGIINPWCYNSSSPTNNPNSFDLWVDVMIGGQTNRFSNWSDTPQIVARPYPYK